MARKFCIMTYGRAGSTALMRTLAARDDIAVPSKNISSEDDELFHPDYLERYLQDYRNLTGLPVANVQELVERFFEHNAASTFAGFKSMPHRHADFSRFVRREDIQFISLSREDLPSTVASFFVAKEFKTWRESGRMTPWTFEASHRERVEKLVTYVCNETQLLDSMPSAIRLTYEELCDPQFQLPELDEFFCQPVRLDNPRAPTSGADYVENWDELCAFIKQITSGAHALTTTSIASASAGVVAQAPSQRDLLDVGQLSPQERLDRGLPMLGANYVEKQLLYGESLLGSEKYRGDFAHLETYCTFLGHAFSGASIVGALLDAHPNIVIAHELDVLRYLQLGFNDQQLYYLLLKNSKIFAEVGRAWHQYSYAVPGQHQGQFMSLQVIGDKKAGGTSLAVSNDWSLLDLLEQTIPHDKKYVHVIRNPFDNIATTTLKRNLSLERSVQLYFGLAKANEEITRRVDEESVFRLHHEDFVDDPRRSLNDLCDFLGVSADESYLNACAAIVYKQPHQSRERIQWPKSAIDYIHNAIDQFSCLSRYSYD